MTLTLKCTVSEQKDHFCGATCKVKAVFGLSRVGWIDQGAVVVIPASCPVRLAVAMGLREATAEEWLDYRLMYSLAVRHIAFNTIRGRHSMYLVSMIVIHEIRCYGYE